ncbi:MAG: hypothetical protein PUC44_03190 [Eubacteriales bacterium]|nr:hypothetical protein [Eubacteriales bacterium]
MGLYNEIMNVAGDLPLFDYMPEEAGSQFDGCFDMHLEPVLKGQSVETNMRVGIVAKGSGQVSVIGKEQEDQRKAERGYVFGMRREKDLWATDLGIMCDERFTADEDSVLILADQRIARSVCYLQCWYHARFLKEFHLTLLKQEQMEF